MIKTTSSSSDYVEPELRGADIDIRLELLGERLTMLPPDAREGALASFERTVNRVEDALFMGAADIAPADLAA